MLWCLRAPGTQGTLRSWLAAGTAAAKAKPCSGAGARAVPAAEPEAPACAQQSAQPEQRAAFSAAGAAESVACVAEPALSAGAGGRGRPAEAQRPASKAGRGVLLRGQNPLLQGHKPCSGAPGAGKRKGVPGAAGGQRSMRAFLAAPKQAPPAAPEAGPTASGAAAVQAGSIAAGAAGPDSRSADSAGAAALALGNGGGASHGCLQASPCGSQAFAGAAASARGASGAGAGPNPGLSPRCNPGQAGAVGRAEAAAAWRSIQQRMQPPLCAGHGEPCVIRQVKKAGPNKGAQASPSCARQQAGCLLWTEQLCDNSEPSPRIGENHCNFLDGQPSRLSLADRTFV